MDRITLRPFNTVYFKLHCRPMLPTVANTYEDDRRATRKHTCFRYHQLVALRYGWCTHIILQATVQCVLLVSNPPRSPKSKADSFILLASSSSLLSWLVFVETGNPTTKRCDGCLSVLYAQKTHFTPPPSFTHKPAQSVSV